MTRRTPQEKKIQSYLRDSRGNDWAKNQRTGRKAVRVRKAHVNRSYRRLTSQVLSAPVSDEEELDSLVRAIKRKSWRKVPDKALIDHLDFVWSDSSRTKQSPAYLESPRRKKALLRMIRARGQDAGYLDLRLRHLNGSDADDDG